MTDLIENSEGKADKNRSGKELKRNSISNVCY